VKRQRERRSGARDERCAAHAGATLLTLSRFRVNPVALMALGGAVRLALRATGI